MFLLFDVGGTKTRLALSSNEQEIEGVKIFETPQSTDDFLNNVSQFLREHQVQSIKACAGGLPGVFDNQKEKLLSAPNLANWVEKPIKTQLSKLLNCSVYLENDADLAGLGEAVSGAGQGYPIVAYLTVSTGVGGTRIVNKKIDAASYGFEPGHQYIDADGTILGKVSDLENLISGTAIKARYGKQPSEIKEEAVWEEIINWLAFGVNNVVVHWSPDIVVIGGGLSVSLPIDKLKKRLNEILTIFPEPPEIKKCQLEELSALYGALHYLLQHHK